MVGQGQAEADHKGELTQEYHTTTEDPERVRWELATGTLKLQPPPAGLGHDFYPSWSSQT
jgi:hypothetical protein